MKKFRTQATVVSFLLMLFLFTQGAAEQTKKKCLRMAKKMETVSIGSWGGQHIRMEVDANGAQLDFDCAHATINQPLKLDANGNFDATGFYVQERGGPVRANEDQSGQPAHFKGRLAGKALTLTIVLDSSADAIGPFTLELGKNARIFKCM